MLALFANCVGRSSGVMSVFRRFWRSTTNVNSGGRSRRKKKEGELGEEEDEKEEQEKGEKKNKVIGGDDNIEEARQNRGRSTSAELMMGTMEGGGMKEEETAAGMMMAKQQQRGRTTATAAMKGNAQKQQQRKQKLAPMVLIRIEGTEGEGGGGEGENGIVGNTANRMNGGEGEGMLNADAEDGISGDAGGGGRTGADCCIANNNNNNAAAVVVGIIGRRERRRTPSQDQQQLMCSQFSTTTGNIGSTVPSSSNNIPILSSFVGTSRSIQQQHCNAVVSSSPAFGQQPIPLHRPCSSSGEVELQQTCLGQPCARVRLSVLYSDQKRLLILTLHELAQTEKEEVPSVLGNASSRNAASPLAFQIRLALLTDCAQPSAKVQKFQSKFHAVDQFQEVQYGQTFAFHCAREQLAGSVVRFRLYRKSKGHQHRPQCLGTAFLRNYLVDANAHRAQNHFLQFRRNLMEQTKSKAKGSLSLFPSLLSLATHHHTSHSHQQQQQQPTASSTKSSISIMSGTPPPPPPPPKPSAFAALTISIPSPSSTTTPTHYQQQQQQQASLPMTPQSASSSRRGSTVDVESGRFCSLPQFGSNQPEVLVSLCYFDAQNRLVVGVDKVAALGGIGKEDAEFFVRISALSPDGTERGKQKSECVRTNGVGETHFNVQAAFHVSRAELDQCTVLVQLFAVHGNANLPLLLRRKQRVGALRLSNSNNNNEGQSEEEGGNGGVRSDAQMHWREMIQGMGLTVDKWHHLLLLTAMQQQQQQQETADGNNGNGSHHQRAGESGSSSGGGGGKLFGGTNFLEATAK